MYLVSALSLFPVSLCSYFSAWRTDTFTPMLVYSMPFNVYHGRLEVSGPKCPSCRLVLVGKYLKYLLIVPRCFWHEPRNGWRKKSGSYVHLPAEFDLQCIFFHLLYQSHWATYMPVWTRPWSRASPTFRQGEAHASILRFAVLTTHNAGFTHDLCNQQFRTSDCEVFRGVACPSPAWQCTLP